MFKKLNIDIWRFVASLFVIAIHISPFEKINPNIDFFFTRILGRIAVPLFLMITGYYILDKSLENKNYLKIYTKKILKIYLLSMIIYFPVNIYMGKLENIHFIFLIKDVFVNGTLYHLWYFPALIVGIWIVYYLIKNLTKRETFIIIIMLYILGLLGDSYYFLVNENLRFIYDFFFNIFDYTRNGLFYTPIFLYLGYVIKSHPKSNNFKLLYIIVLFTCMTVEGFILHHFNLQKHDSMYIFLVPLMYFLFGYLMNYNKTSNKRVRNISTILYIFHPLFIVITRFILKIIDPQKILIQNNLIFYIIVCLLTTVFSVYVERIKNEK